MCNRTMKARRLSDYSLAGRTAPRAELGEGLDLMQRGRRARTNPAAEESRWGGKGWKRSQLTTEKSGCLI